MVEAAATLLDEGGRAAVTLREVGRLTGVSHNAPYRHFANKDDLLGAIAGRELERLTVKGQAGSAPIDSRRLILDYLEWALAYPARFRLASAPWADINQELLASATRWRTLLISSIAQAQARQEIPAGDPERLSSMILALAHGAAHLALAGHLVAEGKGKATAEDLVADLFDLLSCGLTEDAGRKLAIASDAGRRSAR